MHVEGKWLRRENILPANLKSSSLLPPSPFPNGPVVPKAAPPMNSPNMTQVSLLATQVGNEILSLLEERAGECSGDKEKPAVHTKCHNKQARVPGSTRKAATGMTACLTSRICTVPVLVSVSSVWMMTSLSFSSDGATVDSLFALWIGLGDVRLQGKGEAVTSSADQHHPHVK